MRKDLENKLFNDFKNMIDTQLDLFENKPINLYGVECGDGWYDLIYQTLTLINRNLKDDIIQINQIKEKFGRLCIYVTASSEYIYGIIHMAEYLSAYICEECGTNQNVGNLTKSHQKTICEKCIKTYPTDNGCLTFENWKKNINLKGE